MSRPLSDLSILILYQLSTEIRLDKSRLIEICGKYEDDKKISATIYRLKKLELIAVDKDTIAITKEGLKVIHIKKPNLDGIWKMVIFDIPETDRYVRNVLRQKLQDLGFKKWQNSIWISPYELDKDLENELSTLAKKYFVRLIKTTDINEMSDLVELFPEVKGKLTGQVNRSRMNS